MSKKKNHSMKDAKLKILVCCGVKGRIISFVDHLERQFEKKEFDYVFCVGDFFGDGEACEKEWKQFLKTGRTISVPVYTLGPNKKEHVKYYENLVDQQLAPNIFYLGKHGMFSTSEGFNIGYISGVQDPFQGIESEMHTFNYDSLEVFKESFARSGKKMHLLLTSPWPKDINKRDDDNYDIHIKESPDKTCESNLLSWMDMNLTPAYLFSGLRGVFYERTPYRGSSGRITRFIGLGNFYEPVDLKKRLLNHKQRWLYGFVLTKDSAYTHDSPFITSPPYNKKEDYCVQPISKQFFFNLATGGTRNEDAPKNKKFKGQRKQTFEINSNDCWFCLSNQKVSKHMIAAIGNQVYLAGNKGPLIQENLLIATIGHYKSFINIPEDAGNELKVIKVSLNKYFQSSGRGAIYFERNIMSAHFQLQVIPVPNSMVDRLEDAFTDKFKEYGLKLVQIPKNALLHQIVRCEGYFYLELPNEKYFLYTTSGNDTNRFPLHIAREVLASKSLLDVQDRIDWKKCVQEVCEEEKDIQRFKAAFKPFNRLKEN